MGRNIWASELLDLARYYREIRQEELAKKYEREEEELQREMNTD